METTAAAAATIYLLTNYKGEEFAHFMRKPFGLSLFIKSCSICERERQHSVGNSMMEPEKSKDLIMQVIPTSFERSSAS
jgi:hypothetical protein